MRRVHAPARTAPGARGFALELARPLARADDERCGTPAFDPAGTAERS